MLGFRDFHNFSDLNECDCLGSLKKCFETLFLEPQFGSQGERQRWPWFLLFFISSYFWVELSFWGEETRSNFRCFVRFYWDFYKINMIIPPKTNDWNLKIPTWKRKNIYSTNHSNQTLVLVGVETSRLYNSLTLRIFLDSLCKEDRRVQAAQDIRIPPNPPPTLKLPPQK